MKFALFQPRLLVTLVCLIPGLVWADDQPDAALLDELLKLSAPAADWREQLKQPDAPREHAPSPDAQTETLVDFWSHAPDDLKPDPSVPPRLLSWCEAHPENLTGLVRWMPADVTEYQDRLKLIVDRLLVRLRTERQWYEAASATYEWLVLNSRYHRPEFIAGIRREFSGTDGETIAKDIQALARLDPKAAEKLLLQISRSRDAFARTAALVWLHALHFAAPDDPRLRRWRSELQKIAANSSAPIRARDYAVMGIMRARWEGQDEWFLSLFGDTALGAFQNKEMLLRPLVGIVRTDPDRWVPKIIPLAGSPNPVVRNNAVRCLSEFVDERTRPDAVHALLPWVSDPHWAELGNETARLQLVESLWRVNLPDCIPGLLQVAERENDLILSAAAQGLAHYHAKEAGPALKAAAERGGLEMYRADVMKAAALLGAYSVDEMEQAIEALLQQLATENGKRQLEDFDPLYNGTPLDPQVRLGSVLWRLPIENDELAGRLLHRVEVLAASEAQSAERLRVIVAGWPGKVAMESIAQRLQSGKLTAPWIAQLLAHRAERAAEVGLIEGLHGVSRGVQIACTGAVDQVGSVLGGKDRPAQIALLACARHLRLPLPLDSIAPLLDAPDASPSRAAEAYLVSVDDTAARALVLRHHPKEALLLGAKEGYPYDPDGETAGPIADAERLMRKMVLADDGPREILALLSEGFGGNDGQRLVLVYADRTVLQWLDGGGRRRERIVQAGELARLRGWVETQRADNLLLYDEGASDGIQYEYVHLDRNGGRRVFMNNPPGPRRFSGVYTSPDPAAPDPSIYGRVVDQFSAISIPPMEVTYESVRDLPGFRILHARERGKAVALTWNRGKMVVQLQQDGVTTFHVLGKDGLAASGTRTPEVFRDDAGIGRWKSEFARTSGWSVSPGTGLLAGKYLWQGSRNKDDLEGLWASDEKAAPRLLIRGKYAEPVSTADGQWIVVPKAGGENWATPHGMVRIHVADHREFPIDLPPADQLRPLAWLPAHGKVLIYRAKNRAVPGIEPNAGPDAPEFYLIDPASGELSKVTGEFRPLLQDTWRPLQPTSRPNEVWAALPVEQLGTPATVVGRYDTSGFTFQPALTVLGLSFSSLDMWVNEAGRHVTFIVNGDVLRLALP